jgi:hypothetical protein
MCQQVADCELPAVSAAVTAATPMKSTTTMEAMAADTATVPAMLMVFTPKTAEKPATVAVVWITIVIAVGIIVRIIIVVVMVMMFLSLSSWHPNKRHDTY